MNEANITTPVVAFPSLISSKFYHTYTQWRRFLFMTGGGGEMRGTME